MVRYVVQYALQRPWLARFACWRGRHVVALHPMDCPMELLDSISPGSEFLSDWRWCACRRHAAHTDWILDHLLTTEHASRAVPDPEFCR